MSFLQKLGLSLAASAVPSYVAAENFVWRYLEKKFPPTEKNHYHPGQTVNFEGREYKILGFSGHAENIAKNLDMVSGREVWIGDYRTAQHYAKINSGKHSLPLVAVIAQPVDADTAPMGLSRYDNQFAPYLPKEEHQFTIIDLKYVTKNNDTTVSGSLKRIHDIFHHSKKDIDIHAIENKLQLF